MRTIPPNQRAKIGRGVARAAAVRRERIKALEESRARLIQVLDFCGSYVESQSDGDPLAAYLARELEHAKEESQLAGMEGASFVTENNLPDRVDADAHFGKDAGTPAGSPSDNGADRQP